MVMKTKVSAIIDGEKFEVINTLFTNKLYRNDKIILSGDGIVGMKDTQMKWDEKLEAYNEFDWTKGKSYKYIFYKNERKFVVCVYWDTNPLNLMSYIGLRMQIQVNGKYIAGKKFKVKELYDLSKDLTSEDEIKHTQYSKNRNQSDEVSFKVVNKVRD